VRLVFAGTPQAAVPSLTALLASHHEVVAVISRPDAQAGRGRKINISPVKQAALDEGVPVLTPAKPSEPEFLAELRELAPDCCPVVAYGALLRPEALAVPAQGWINLHFSLLPAWRGAAPVQHAVLAGDEVTGASTFLIEAGMDTGPVFGVLTEEVRPTDTSGDLLERLSMAGAQLLVATLDAVEAGTARPQPQPADGVSMAPKITVADTRVDWTAPPLRVDRLIRAATPDPGAWTTFRDKRVKLGPVRLLPPLAEPLEPGQLLDRGKEGVAVGTAGRPVKLGQLQPEGKAPMPAEDWARGVRPSSSDRFL
jgi:methionyl-tRNA formyltransferase